MAFKTPPYRLIPLSRIILAKLYEQHVNDEASDRYSVDDVAKMFSVPISKNLINSALIRLHSLNQYNNQIVQRRGSKKTGSEGYVIGQKGIELIEKALLQRNSDIAYYLENGDPVLDEIAGIDGQFFTDTERFDRADWAPLQIDRSAPEYIDAVSSAEEAVETIRADNGFAANYPAERDGILDSLRQGVEWLKSKSPTPAQIKSMLIAPLNWVAVTFGNALTGAVAKKAAQKLVDFLMSLIS